MPIDPLLGTAGLTVGNSLLNWFTGGQDMQNQQAFNQAQSQQQMAWNEKMQGKQWQQQQAFWHMMNQYNSPQSQMARFKEAGLNPHLIYGQGNAGNAAAQSVPDVKPYSKAEASSHIRGMDVFGDFNRFQNIQAQTDNLESQSSLAQQTALLTAQKTANEAITGKRAELDYGIARDLRDTQISAAKANLEKVQNDIRKSSVDIEYLEKSLPTRLKRVKVDLDNALRDGNIKRLDAAIKQFEVNLNKSGLTRSDSRAWRLLDTYKEELRDMLKKTPEKAKKFGWDVLRHVNPYVSPFK